MVNCLTVRLYETANIARGHKRLLVTMFESTGFVRTCGFWELHFDLNLEMSDSDVILLRFKFFPLLITVIYKFNQLFNERR